MLVVLSSLLKCLILITYLCHFGLIFLKDGAHCRRDLINVAVMLLLTQCHALLHVHTRAFLLVHECVRPPVRACVHTDIVNTIF